MSAEQEARWAPVRFFRSQYCSGTGGNVSECHHVSSSLHKPSHTSACTPRYQKLIPSVLGLAGELDRR